MRDYYSDKLSAERLKKVYDIASPRIRQYLDAEVAHVIKNIHTDDIILELGCGYGRVIPKLAKKARLVIGIDTSYANLTFGTDVIGNISNCQLLLMDALQLGFCDHVFNCVVCIQNGISAFHVNQYDLIKESIRVAKPEGTILFSSYSDKFWEERLEWFHLQSAAGLLGEIDYDKTRNGVIVCKDGFTATTVRQHELQSLTAEFNTDTHIIEVDESSLFCEIIPH